MSRTPNYILTSAVSIAFGKHDYKVLDVGTFVTPLQLSYVPQHVIDDPFNRHFNEKTEVFCYCRYGVFAIPKDRIREV